MEPTQQQPLAGADRIRSLQDEDAVFQAFDSYPWKKDPMFMSGLNAILGSPGTSQGSPTDMATHARIFYYAQRIGTSIEFSAYTAWLDRHPEHSPPDVLPEEHRLAATPAPSSALPWQQAAPKAALFVDKSAQRTETAPSADGEEPSYPMAFAEMIKLLQEGKPIPGIREIPNTIAREPNTKPVGGRPAPRKPWEKDIPVEAPKLDFTNTLDADFPPVETSSTIAN
ncbi:hypothetical protein NLU13_6305 [Sarocladium strictum]|uniref:Uncharacterized protein n=1 Tax=Sarocladium strictum TaxID=5046 RepID=A0AA39GFN0_SARSR|nr:hypothetical protein NLU13_6305 [Sarocladium strictum]